MRTWLHLASAFALATSLAVAQDEVTKTEKTVTTEATADGEVSREAKTVTVTQYVDRLEAAYRSAGVPQDKITRLVALDRQIFIARKEGRESEVRALIEEQKRILNEPELIRKVVVYLQSHPVTIASPPDYFISTWEAPAYRSFWNVDVGSATIGSTGVNVTRGVDAQRSVTTQGGGTSSVSGGVTTTNRGATTAGTGTVTGNTSSGSGNMATGLVGGTTQNTSTHTSNDIHAPVVTNSSPTGSGSTSSGSIGTGSAGSSGAGTTNYGHSSTGGNTSGATGTGSTSTGSSSTN